MLVLFILTSCSNKSLIVNEEKTQFSNPMSFIGDIHNQALDAISLNNVSLDNLCEFSHSCVEKEFSYQNIPLPKMSEFTTKSLIIAKELGIQCTTSYLTRGQSESKTADSLYHEMPQNYKIFIDDMLKIINYNGTDSLVIAQQFNNIDKAINLAPDLSDEDKEGLWACSAIAYSSYMYNLANISTKAVNAGDLVKADLMSAAGTFICWRFWGKTLTGLMFGPGGAVMTGAREVLKGAIVGSAVYVAVEL